jgi:hypothetical protein
MLFGIIIDCSGVVVWWPIVCCVSRSATMIEDFFLNQKVESKVWKFDPASWNESVL